MQRPPTSQLVLVLACAANFLVVFDTSVITVGLPSIERDLDVSFDELGWVVNGYTLAFAGLLLVGGRLADVYGQQRAFVGGVFLFTAASLLGGLAMNGSVLVFARVLQGAGAAVMAPLAVTMLTTTFEEGRARTWALTFMIGVSQVGGALGNVLGGVMTEHLSWRSMLLVNVPIGIPLLLFGARVLSTRGARSNLRLDLPGALLATAGISCLAYGVSGAGDQSLSETVTGPAGWGALLLLAFVLVEARWSSDPLVPLRLFTLPGLAWGNLAMILAGMSQVPMWFFLTLTFQNVLGYDAMTTGIAFLPYAGMMIAVGLWVTPRLMRLMHARMVVALGASIAALGFWWQGNLSADGTYVSEMLGPAVAMSVGGALFGTPLARTVTSGVSHSQAGAASGVMATAKQVGAAVGLALLVGLTAPPGKGAADLAEAYGDAFYLMAASLVLIAILTPLLPAQRDERVVAARD